MKEIIRHIEILLLDNDCVIVPGFGGFVTQHVPAHYEREEGMYFPPIRTLGFNPHLKMNDSLLVQSYADTHEMSYPDAMHCVEAEVEEMRKRLGEEGRCELHGLGMLLLNGDGNMEFEPCLAGVLTPRYYGLSSYEIACLEEKASQSAPVVNINDVELFKPEQEGKEDNKRSFHFKMNWIRNAAVACAIGFTFFMLPQLQTNGNDPVSVNTGLLSRVMPKDIVNGNPAMQPIHASSTMMPETDGLQLPSFVMNSGKLDELFMTEDVEKSYFSIVLASHVSVNNAIDFVKELHLQGLSGAKVLPKGSVKVIYGHFETKEEAYNVLIPLRENDANFADAWVMEID